MNQYLRASPWDPLYRRLFYAFLLAGATLLPSFVHGSGTVTSCTESALDTALAGGGTVTFTCDGTITVTGRKTISADTVLDTDGHVVTISGGSNVQIFNVTAGVTLTLLNLTLSNGSTTTNGGAIYNAGTVNATNCIFFGNQALGTNGISGTNGSNGSNGGAGGSGTSASSARGGAIYNLGTVMLGSCTFSSNSAVGGTGGVGGNGGNGSTGSGGNGGFSTSGSTGYAGGIYNLGSLSMEFCQFLTNNALGGNGGAGGAGGNGFNSSGGTGRAGGNGGSAYGGAIYSSNAISVVSCSFVGNGAVGGPGANGGNNGYGNGNGNEGAGGNGGEGTGAGVYLAADSSLSKSTFYSNVGVGGNGGDAGIAVGYMGDGPNVGADGGGGGKSLGGGVYNRGTNGTVNCTFYYDSTRGGSGGRGGAGFNNGGDGGDGGSGYGGGLYNFASIGVTNCTFSSCSRTGGTGGFAGSGYSNGSVGANGSTLGAGIYGFGATFKLKNSIIAYSLLGGNASGTISDSGNNISSDTSITLTGTSHSNTDPKLDVLADNGGFTKTCALLAGSPAIDTGSDSAAPPLDQRGYFRSGTSDIGSFERGGSSGWVRALGPSASLDGNVGLFAFGGPSNGSPNSVTVDFTIGGTASNGVDYAQITNSLVIPPGAHYAQVLVRGIPGAFAGTNKTISVSVIPSEQYQPGQTRTNATIVLFDHNTYDSSKRYVRGTSTAGDFHSFVIPLDFEKGVPLDSVGGNATNLFPGNPWTTNLYHFDATNTASQNILANRILFQNPIVAFGDPVGGSALYLNQSYSFGIHGGNCSSNLTGAIRVQVYYRSNSAYVGSITIPLPDFTNTNQLTTFVTNGFTVTAEQYGLRTVLLDTPGVRWGAAFGETYILTHTASAAATNYYYSVEQQGYSLFNSLVLNQSGGVEWSRLYAMEFSPFPSGRSTFIDQPHFDGLPLPATYQGKTLQELTNIVATLPNLSYLVSSNYLTIDASPELRRHPILDQFVKDLGNDPLTLANYVINEIDLTDPIDYDTNYNSQPAVNLGGVDRSALATFQEGQGSPVEQCALLVYLLRQAGVPATYVYPTNSGLQMLDFQVSKLLRTQLRGALTTVGQTNLPQLINVNYPWVAAYVGTNWVQVFPWMKDTEIVEGFDLYDYMPTNYNSGYKWMSQFIAGDTNIFSLSSSDQPLDLLPLFIQKSLNTNYPGLSVDDMGVQIVNRRHLYSQWSEFPKPFWLSGSPIIIESLQTNLNLFNTIQIKVFSQSDPSKLIDTSEMFVVDLHNRKLLLKFLQVGTTSQHDMVLSLNSYATNIISQTNFSTTANPTWKLITTNRLNTSDYGILFQVTHRRLRFLPSNYAAPYSTALTNLWGYNYFEQGQQKQGRIFIFNDQFRKGDLVTFCLDVGKVSQKMLNVHAQEIWQFSRTADTNQPSTLDPDVYAGTTAYLMGMSYFNYVDRFLDLDDRLHKVQTLSSYSHGYGLIQPQRDANGNLPNNAVILVSPVVHIPNNGQAFIFNGTLRPDSGRDDSSALLDWWLHWGLQSSAAEHAVLRSYYQTNAISTVKLLQSVGTNIVKLNAGNYQSFGTNLYHGVALSNADAFVWSRVVALFMGSDYDRQAWLTPGIVTNGGYVGVGALLFSYYQFTSAVGGLNGGIADPFSANTFTPENSVNITVVLSKPGEAAPFQLLSTSVINNPNYLLNAQPAFWSDPTINSQLANNQVHLDPSFLLAGSQMSAMQLSAYNQVSIFNSLFDEGVGDTQAEYNGDASRRVSDPVDILTGGFYVDALDLSLPGPMPLQIRRNYSSQNLAENQFGFGWKISYVPFLTINTNASVVYAAEMDGSFVGYRQTATNVNVWLPQAQDNPTLNNNSSLGSVANLFNNRLMLTNSAGTNVYTLTGADGSIRTFTQRSYAIGSFSRQRPYLDKWQDNSGNFYTLEYGTDSTRPDYGQLRRIQSSNGNFAGFYYNVYGQIVEAYTADGRRLQYDYDEFGDLVTVTFPDESEISYQYQHSNYVTNSITNLYSTHLIIRELKPDGRALKNDYDSKRRVTNQYSTVGIDLNLVRNATFLYTNNFSLGATNVITGTTTILDYTNRPTIYYYTNSLIRKIVDPLNQTIVEDWYETDTAGGYRRSLKSRTDKRGLQTALLYDSLGNVTNTTITGDLSGDGTTTNAVTSATYDINNLPLQVVDPVNNSVSYVYHTNFPFLPQQVKKYAGAVAVSTNFFFYESVTNVLTVGTNQVTNSAFGVLRKEIRAFGSLDAATNEWFTDGRGFPTNAVQYTRTSDPNVTNQFIFNGRGQMVKRTDAAGRSFLFAFDALGRVIGREIYDTGQTQPMDWEYFYYNDNGELTWTDGPRFDPEDYVWRDYDGAGRETTEIRWRTEAKADGSGVKAPADPNLYATTFSRYDPFGNLVQVIDPRGNYSQMDYDGLGRMLRQRSYNSTGTALATNSFGYESGNLVASVTNALGGVTTKQYNSRAQLKFQANPDGSTNAWRYYLDGRLRREIQRNGAYWETSYDDVSRNIARTFYTATGVLQATDSVVLDRRGNTVERLDAGSNLFTNSFDGLDRPKVAVGPQVVAVTLNQDLTTYTTSIVQQVSTHLYDASGKTLIVSNALGEKTITTYDPLTRPVSSQTYAAGAGSPLRVTTSTYSANHHSLTITNGTGASAIISTIYTDNAGRNVLSIGYPAPNSLEYTWRDYDSVGNLTYEERDSSTNNAATAWAGAAYVYDGLNRRTAKSDRDAASTYFYYDASGNLTNRVMPGALQWNATYNNAGQMLKEWNIGNGGIGTHTNTYGYYGIGSSFVGLLATRTNAVGRTCTYTYDDWLRLTNSVHTTADTYALLHTDWGYDERGLLTNITEHFVNKSTGPETKTVFRSYDAYGQLTSESISLFDDAFSGAGQAWDAAGRRTGLYMGFNYNFGLRADGLPASISTSVGNATYGYDTAGVLTNRQVANRATTIGSRDGIGRPLSITTKVNTLTKLAETLAWTGDGLLASHTVGREDFTNSAAYLYADQTRRLVEERLNLDATKRLTNAFIYDGGMAAGPGVLSKGGQTSNSWSATLDAFSRVNSETNTSRRLSAYGRVNGMATMTALLDGQPMPVTLNTNSDAAWTNQWRSVLELTPGTHQLQVSATHPSGFFTTNKTSWFTNDAVNETLTNTYGARGILTQRIWRSSDGTTTRQQTIYWDEKERPYMIYEYDNEYNGYLWLADYDGLGRRLRTRSYTTIGGVTEVANPTGFREICSYYDPQVEFLELGVNVDGKTTWKIYGPDLSGAYGGMNGVGGLDAIAPGLGALNPTIADARGNVLASVTNGTVSWNPSRPTGYGAAPSYRPVPLGYGADVAQASAWRGVWSDITGLYWRGKRYYEPVGGHWMSYDPVWNDRDPNYYTFCGGDPINAFDPDGRFGVQSLRSGNAQIGSFEDSFVNGTVGLAQMALYGTGNFLGMPEFIQQADSLEGLKSPLLRFGTYSPGSLDAQIGENVALVMGFYGMARQIPLLTSRLGNWWKSLQSDPVPDLPIPASPNSIMRGNANARDTYVDPLSNQTVPASGILAADHIVPQEWIKSQPGFSDLVPAQQDWLLNHPLNTQGLPTPFNSSKGPRSPGDWTTYKGQPLDPAYIQNDSLRGQMLENWIQQQIRNFNAANAQNR